MGVTKAGFSQFTFGVSPGLSLNSAYFGYKLGKFVPFVGIQYFGASLDYSYSYKEFNYNTGMIEDKLRTTEGKLKLFVPNIGAKYFFFETEKLKAHATLNITKPIITGQFEYDGDPDDYLEDLIDGVSVWGGELSFGTEYFFDEHFSVGGEFGLRYLNFKSNSVSDGYVYNPFTGQEIMYDRKESTKINGNPTFSRISLNFYF